MVNTRLDFHKLLVSALGSKNVYFQPPESKSLTYPCIVYKLASIPEKYADNTSYTNEYMYKVTLMHEDPDNDIVDKLLKIKHSKFENHYATQGLNHYVFNIYHKNEKEIK